MSKHEDAIRQGAGPLLEPGEEIIAAIVASPRGSQTAVSGGGGAAGTIGGRWAGKNRQGAETAGLVVKRSCGVALTPTRLVTLDLGISMMGAVKEVKDVLSAIPLEAIDSLEAKRMGAAGVITVMVDGAEFKLESKAGAAKELAEAFARAKGAARPA